MPKITINLAGTGPVPPGEYIVEAERMTLRDKNDGESQYLHIALRIVGGQHDGEPLDTIASLRPDMVQMLGRTLCALGVEDREVEIDYEEELVRKTSWGNEYERVVTEPDVVGKRALAVVAHREVGSQTYARVRTLKAMPDA